MKLYVWRPKSYGFESYFVMAESQEEAWKAVRKEVGEGDWIFNKGKWDEYYEPVEVLGPNEVATNGND